MTDRNEDGKVRLPQPRACDGAVLEASQLSAPPLHVIRAAGPG